MCFEISFEGGSDASVLEGDCSLYGPRSEFCCVPDLTGVMGVEAFGEIVGETDVVAAWVFLGVENVDVAEAGRIRHVRIMASGHRKVVRR
jgi:hypothetical protein